MIHSSLSRGLEARLSSKRGLPCLQLRSTMVRKVSKSAG